MRILVVGGYGLIGSYVVSRLVADGHEVVGAGRRVQGARRRWPRLKWVRIDLATATSADWRLLLDNIDVVVNCAGALQDGPRDRLEWVHVDGLKALAEGARLSGVSRFVHVSAAGAANNIGAFGRTKIAGEVALANAGMDWVVLRPGLIFAPAAYGGSALLRGLAAFPFVIPAVYTNSPVHVSSAMDVAEAAAHAVLPEAPTYLAIDLVAPGSHSLGDILIALRAWMGLRPAPVVSLPVLVAVVVSTVADAVAWLGWLSPLRSAALTQLRAGVRGDPDGAGRVGVRMRALEDILAAEPSGVQERWFAKLYFLKPASIAALAIAWTASGVIGLAESGRAARILIDGGFDAHLARACAWSGSLADIGVGALACHRASARLALWGMLILSAAYAVGASIWRPDLWADPLGPLVKILPGAALACVALALLDDR